MAWGIYKQRDFSGEVVAVHTIPTEDIQDHLYERCPCSPRLDRGRLCPLIKHNSFDGRELKDKIILGRN